MIKVFPANTFATIHCRMTSSSINSDGKKKMRRQYLNARNFAQEAVEKVKDFDAIMGRVRQEYERLRKEGIECPAFKDEQGNLITIQITRSCWNHVFKHPRKRRRKYEKIERAICLPEAIKLIRRNTTYQEVSREKDKGNNVCLYFALIGYIRGNRIKVIIRKQEKNTNPKYTIVRFEFKTIKTK